MKTKRSVNYARTATENPQAIEAQHRRMGEFVRQQGWTCVERIEDCGVSGCSEDRQGLRKVRKLVVDGLVDVVVVPSFDRLSRSLRSFLSIQRELDEHGVELTTVDGSVNTATPIGRLQMRLLTSFAEFERDMVRGRIQEGIQRAWKRLEEEEG